MSLWVDVDRHWTCPFSSEFFLIFCLMGLCSLFGGGPVGLGLYSEFRS